MTAVPDPSIFPDDPPLRFELKRSELAALIHRLVPPDTWMGQRSQQVILETFGDAARAAEVADQVTESLIRAHDQSLS